MSLRVSYSNSLGNNFHQSSFKGINYLSERVMIDAASHGSARPHYGLHAVTGNRDAGQETAGKSAHLNTAWST